MISELPSSTSTLPKVDLNYLVHRPGPVMLSAHNLLNDISNIVHRSPTTTSNNCTLIGDLSFRLSRFQPATHFNRVAPVGSHDKDTWVQEWDVRDTTLDAVAASSSPGSNRTVLADYFPVKVIRKRESFTIMELQTEMLRTKERFPNSTWFGEDAILGAHDWTPLVAPVPCVSPIWYRPATRPYSYEDLCEGRRRVGEILALCGVLKSEVAPVESAAVGCGDTSGAHRVAPIVSGVTAKLSFRGNDVLLVTALADWTSVWVQRLVVQPYLQGSFCFQYQGKRRRASTLAAVALRIRRVLCGVENPLQVAIHALWFISTLAGNGVHDNPAFLSIPIFRYLHNNGTSFAEDFMFRTFVTCAMIGDKTVNDATLSTKTWNRLTHIPQVILNATEKYALSCLKWNVSMTRIQWQDTIIYLRSCIKMGSASDPFAYDGTSPSNIMARCLDDLINLSGEDESHETFAVDILPPKLAQPFKHSEVSMDWCPKDDPVINQKPRTIGIAPGADQNQITYMTAKDLLDSITGSSDVPDLGTSFRGSFGAIGARLAHSIKVAGACKGASWVPSHG